jgi:hypothetical protein
MEAFQIWFQDRLVYFFLQNLFELIHLLWNIREHWNPVFVEFLLDWSLKGSVQRSATLHVLLKVVV